MRISDWSSDVCSSDLSAERQAVRPQVRRRPAARPRTAAGDLRAFRFGRRPGGPAVGAPPMIALLQTLKSRFDNRPDSEPGPALTPVAMLVVEIGRGSGRERWG